MTENSVGIESRIKMFCSTRGRLGYLSKFPEERRSAEDAIYCGFKARTERIRDRIHYLRRQKEASPGTDVKTRQDYFKYLRKTLDLWKQLDKDIKRRIKKRGVGFGGTILRSLRGSISTIEQAIADSRAEPVDDLDYIFGDDDVYDELTGGGFEHGIERRGRRFRRDW